MDLDVDAAGFERGLLGELQAQVRQRLTAAAPRFRSEVQDAVGKAAAASPEYEQLNGGSLRDLFGLADPQPLLQAIVAGFRNGVYVTVTPARGDSLGGLLVEILRDDLGDVLSLPEASYLSHSVQRNTDTLVPWLEWLLKMGDRVILPEWVVVRPHSPGGTRTGGGVMVQPRTPRNAFSVPAEFSGTADANWLTRCLEAALPDIEAAAGRVVESL